MKQLLKYLNFCVIFHLAFIFPNVQPLAVMSVDLGSEWMKIAIVSPGVPMEIILNTDSQRKTPLAVAFRDGERFIGDSALNVGIRFPEKTFTHFIDLVGKNSLKSVAVQKYLERFPHHKLVETVNNTLAFVFEDGGQEMSFTPEELLSMLLFKAREYAEKASASSSPSGQMQKITDCVLTVQPYFSQKERQAVKFAADLAGLKVLQLINVNSAFALNYGVFRRKDFNSTNPTNILFYDMGAGSTLATIASYQLVKTKERGFTEVDPQLTIKGVAFDRYLGGFELQLRLRDHLLKLFSEQSKKTVEEIRKNKRAMAKLLKEAGRLKKVLSANQEHRAQIENVMNDVDLKAVVTREEFETIAGDLLKDRVTEPLDKVFKSSSFTLAEIDSFIIIGGSTRIPRVQQLLEAYWKKDLSKNINADEAGALGAAYQAAYLSKGFKVKTFHLKDSNMYQINVDFEKETANDEKRIVSRTLFARGNTFPQKKVITFNKNRKDFSFEVNYVEPIPQDNIKTIAKISTVNVLSIFDKYTQNQTAEPKGIKVHFRMDESGILTLENSEALFEVEYEEINEQDNYEQISNLVGDAISKFGSKISSLFGTNNEGQVNGTEQNNVNVTGENNVNDPNSVKNETLESGSESKINVTDETMKQNLTRDPVTGENITDNSSNKTSKNLKKEIKKKMVKENIKTTIELLGDFEMSKESVLASQQKLLSLNKREKDKLERDQMKNTLESFIHETRDKLSQDEYSTSITDEEKAIIENELSSVSEWLDYESDAAQADVFGEHLSKLYGKTKELFDRVREHRERPEALKSLTNMLDIAEMFYNNSQTNKDDQVFTEVELGSLRKLIDETKTWMSESVREQDALPSTTNPILTVALLVEKMSLLDREVKYLLNKARITPPKKKPDAKEPSKEKDDTEIPQTEKEEKPEEPKEKSQEEPGQKETSDSLRTEEETILEGQPNEIDPEKVSTTAENVPYKTEL